MPRKLKDCEAGKIRNPSTNRCVKETGTIGKKIKTGVEVKRPETKCPEGKIRNPPTNRCVNENGTIGKKLKAKCKCDDKAQCECDETKQKAASKIVLAIKARKARKEVEKRREAKNKDYFQMYNRKMGNNINVYSNLYEVLDLPLKSSLSEIKKKYKKLAIAFHPDKYMNKSDEMKLRAEEEIKFINEAYQVLGKQEYKNQYDKLLDEAQDYMRDKPLSDIVRNILTNEINKDLMKNKIVELLDKFTQKHSQIPFTTRRKISTKINILIAKRDEGVSDNELKDLVNEIETLLRPY